MFRKLTVDSREGWRRKSRGRDVLKDRESNRCGWGEKQMFMENQTSKRFTWSILWYWYWFSMLGERGNLCMAGWTCVMVKVMLCKLLSLHLYIYKKKIHFF